MYFLIHNRRVIRGLVAGAVALAGASACSRSDRAGAGRDTTQTGAVTPADSQANPSAQSTSSAPPAAGAQPGLGDTSTGTPSAAGTSSVDSSPASKTAHHAPGKTGARHVAGYKAMSQDTAAAGQDSSAASSSISDSAQSSAAGSQPTDTSGATSDTTATKMADANAQADTSTQAQADTATIGDTAVILTQADTSQSRTDSTQQTEVAVVPQTDTTAATATAGVANDSAAAERIHGDTVPQKATDVATAEPARIRPPADSTADAAVGAAGVASTGNIATGTEAVAQMSSQGQRCTVATTEDNRDVQWDMASSPATLNPCGTGTMTLPRIWTGEKK